MRGMQSGLRAGELLSLRPESFELAGKVPEVRVKAINSKHRREDRQPLPPSLIPSLSAWLAGKPARAEGCRPSGTTGFSKMIRTDEEAAGVPYRPTPG